MRLTTPRRVYQRLRVRLLGAHQLDNAAVAVAAMELAAERGGFALSEAAVRRGLVAARWPGRMEIARRRPVLTVLDGAHNRDSVARLLAAAAEEFPGHRPLAAVFGCAADKDVKGMLDELAPRLAGLVATETGNPRRLDPRVIAEMAGARGVPAVAVETEVGDALRRAWAAAGPKGLVLVTGSLYLVGRAKCHLGRPAKPR
jgi:dihydrofolate synthase/folylpolyglutamate synthase